ncbi:hypothetical protein J23TS9_39770 [Paenibacillus sp. J23TS9]|uniref:hypothetical protein n=1 Tax=Paenibacillus sp. J23TS9 TaxID=2807193 RepID=UPI001B28FEC1|nr:hypothetical protein [Paenibacillus sp. J23TS9]GIP28847.1 hypothetical protein J23TS9_39770 [Paenibacillus sp. J23TS9]
MVIAFVVLAIVALIFLFVYNSRLTKRSGKRQDVREEPAASSAPPAAPSTPAAPAAVVTPAPPVESHATVEQEQRVIAPEAPDRIALVEAESEAHRSASDGDRAYREALRKFAGHTPVEEESSPPPVKKPDPSSDDAYREALRAMMRDQGK